MPRLHGLVTREVAVLEYDRFLLLETDMMPTATTAEQPYSQKRFLK
jgi:hypothetical protein